MREQEVSVAVKKDVPPSAKKPSPGSTASSIAQPQQVEGEPATIEEALALNIPKLEEALKTLPADKLAAARKETDQLLSGDLSWADLSKYTPEKLFQIAEMGFNQFRLGQYESGERLFKGLTVIDPGNYYYHQMLGAVFQRREKYAEAIVEYSVAADLNPKDIVSMTNRGEIYMKLGVLDLANADFDKAIGLDEKSEDKWANRSRMLREQIRLMKQRKKK